MRNLIFKIFLFTLLLGAVQHFYGHNQHEISYSKKEKSHKIHSSQQSSDQLDLTEMDLEESHHSGDDFHDEIPQPNCLLAATSFEKWLQSFELVFSTPQLLKPQQIGTHFGYTTPIYLSHRVLRI